jgi:SAM-dependent methyltransferase
MGKPENIKAFWNRQAKEWKTSPNVSWKDTILIKKEINSVSRWIKDHETVLDFGCANGWTTLRIGRMNPTCDIQGMDFSPEMIRQARKASPNHAFRVQDVLTFRERAKYDCVYTVRMLINQPTFKLQLKAIDNLWRAVKPGGRLILSEATLEGWTRMNRLRTRFGLKPLGMPWHNLYLEHRRVVEYMRLKSANIGIYEFASTYYWMTRFLRPFLFGEFKEVTFNTWFHRWAGFAPNFGKWSTQKTMVFEKSK